MDQRFDVIIIGSGAGGGTLARHLAPSGKRILILERGDWLKREAKNWDAAAVFVDNRYVSPDTWYDRDGRPFQPQVHYFVGGATKMFGAALYRLRRQDFGELKHYDGVSPAWPISYEELEPYYAKAEEMYHVHGLRGHDPTEPPASGPYPCPPVSDEPHDKHPNGLGNGSGQVGRNYMFHNSQAVLAISLEPNTTIFQKTLALNDFYFGMDGFEYPMGNIQMLGKSSGTMYRGEKPLETALLPTGLLDNLADHAVDFWLTTEDLPDPENRVTVDRSGKVTLSYTPNNQVPTRKLYDRLKSMLSHLGMHPDHLIPRNLYMKTEVPIAGCAHQAGTCRFGRDAKTSVLDRNCKALELDNLYVVDTSFFVSIGAVNPSPTAIANAIRGRPPIAETGVKRTAARMSDL